MIRKFRSLWKSYLWQSCLAALTVFLVLLFLNLEHAVGIAAIGATVFIVVAMPDNVTAKSRNIIGGHLVGFLTGSLCALIPQPSPWCSMMAYALAVGLSIFMMVVYRYRASTSSSYCLGVGNHGVLLERSKRGGNECCVAGISPPFS